MSSTLEQNDGSSKNCDINDTIHGASFHYVGQSPSEIPSNIVQLIVDDSVTVIPDSTFRSLEQLERIQFGAGLKKIGEEAFAFCLKIKSVSIPASVEVIGEGAFHYCTALEEVNFVLERCALKTIDDRCFLDCHALCHIKLPNSVTYLGNAAFGRCKALLTLILSERLPAIEPNTFADCYSLVTVRIPIQCTSIGGAAFSCCHNLVSVEMAQQGSSVAIDRFAFSWCKSLTTIALPRADAYWGEDVLNYCDKLLQAIHDEFPRGETRDDFYMRNALKLRFDLLPIHRLCYNLAFERNQLKDLKDRISEIIKVMEDDTADLKTNAISADCCGLTPFHILAISQDLNPTFFEALQKMLPDDWIWQADKWGRSSVYYLSLNPSPLALDLLRNLLQPRILARLEQFRHEPWRLDIRRQRDKCMAMMDNTGTNRCQRVGKLLYDLKRYERLEGISWLELALWKAKMEDFHSHGPKNKLRRIRDTLTEKVNPESHVSARRNQRDHCGAPVVIPNVLSFLNPSSADEGEPNDDLLF